MDYLKNYNETFLFQEVERRKEANVALFIAKKCSQECSLRIQSGYFNDKRGSEYRILLCGTLVQLCSIVGPRICLICTTAAVKTVRCLLFYSDELQKSRISKIEVLLYFMLGSTLFIIAT